jgi:WD repeat and SOF domain-containing protein 1
VKFNPAEPCLLGSTAADRSICLYDLRSSAPMRKFVLSMKSNKLAWNPMEPFNFVLANEDSNLYTFDMRNLSKALMIHKDHIAAVMDVAFSPTGREFVSAGYDRTIRIFDARGGNSSGRVGAGSGGRSREVYHTKRMQRVFCVNFSADSKFVLSGSDDTNIRIWKAAASAALGVSAGRKERKELYQSSLQARFGHLPEIKRITVDKKVPKYIKKAGALRHVQLQSKHRKQENRKRHSSPGSADVEPERKRAVVKEFDKEESKEEKT